MALKINEECINCDVCESQCPNQAIYQGLEIYEINPELCTQCVGHYEEPRCQLLCPVDCIDLDVNYQEDEVQLLAKYKKIK